MNTFVFYSDKYQEIITSGRILS